MNHPLDRLSDPLQRAGAALGCAAKSIADFIRAMVEFAAAVYPPEMLKVAKELQALKEAPPRVRHLAYHSKKHRTQRKNINRALREYQRRTHHDNRTVNP